MFPAPDRLYCNIPIVAMSMEMGRRTQRRYDGGITACASLLKNPKHTREMLKTACEKPPPLRLALTATSRRARCCCNSVAITVPRPATLSSLTAVHDATHPTARAGWFYRLTAIIRPVRGAAVVNCWMFMAGRRQSGLQRYCFGSICWQGKATAALLTSLTQIHMTTAIVR